MWLDLAPEPQDEAAAGERLQVVGRGGERHRAAGERHSDPGAEVDVGRGAGGQQEREERIVVRLRRPDAVVPGSLLLGRLRGERSEIV